VCDTCCRWGSGEKASDVQTVTDCVESTCEQNASAPTVQRNAAPKGVHIVIAGLQEATLLVVARVGVVDVVDVVMHYYPPSQCSARLTRVCALERGVGCVLPECRQQLGVVCLCRIVLEPQRFRVVVADSICSMMMRLIFSVG
jgi:hypothetical protein